MHEVLQCNSILCRFLASSESPRVTEDKFGVQILLFFYTKVPFFLVDLEPEIHCVKMAFKLMRRYGVLWNNDFYSVSYKKN